MGDDEVSFLEISYSPNLDAIQMDFGQHGYEEGDVSQRATSSCYLVSCKHISSSIKNIVFMECKAEDLEPG